MKIFKNLKSFDLGEKCRDVPFQDYQALFTILKSRPAFAYIHSGETNFRALGLVGHSDFPLSNPFQSRVDARSKIILTSTDSSAPGYHLFPKQRYDMHISQDRTTVV